MKKFRFDEFLSNDMKVILDIVGEEKFLRIVELYGGHTLYVPSRLKTEYRNYLIYYEYVKCGMSVRELSLKWDITVSGIRYIINMGNIRY